MEVSFAGSTCADYQPTAVPRKGTGTNVIQFHPGQAFLSEHNLPDIMYQLYPCAEWKRFKDSPLPAPKYNPDRTPVYEQYTRPGHERQQLLDFKILPDKASFTLAAVISTEEGWWYHEFVRRMDPRIRQRDIIMREEASEERLRMSDPRYINIHLNTPGYRSYRPVWKMIAWHVTAGDERTNLRKQLVLDSLTDAQKQANITRGSTPGLINPALDDIPGNRIELPALGSKKRGPKRAVVNVNNNPVTQSAQYHQTPEARQTSQVNQTHQAPQSSRAPQADHDQQASQSSRARSSDVATASSYVASATIGTPSQNISTIAARPEQNNSREHANAQARDAAAMPPPSPPLQPRNDPFLQPQVPASHSEPMGSASQPPEFDGIEASSKEVEDVGATNDHVPEPEYPFLSDEEIVTMNARSDKAMAEISWLCEPFLDPSTDLQGPPPMDLSAELIDDLGIGFMFPSQASGNLQEKRNRNAMPNRVETMQARNVTQTVQKTQGTKRKQSHENNENFQDVQLDVEKQERRPIKRVKSVHGANFQSNNGQLYQDAAYNFQQQPHFAPKVGNYQSGYICGQTFIGPAMQGAQPPQHYPSASSTKRFPDRQQSTSSAYIPARAARDEIADQQSSFQQLEGSVEGFPDGDIQSGQALDYQSFESPSTPNAQYIGHQSAMAQPRLRADRGNHRELRRNTNGNRRFHPYANQNMRTAQSAEAAQGQQLGGIYHSEPLSDRIPQVDHEYIPEAGSASSEDTSPPSRVPDLPLNPHSEGFFIYKNNDPRQGP